MLGKNAQKFSVTKKGNAVCLVGLTATASFDVLADIERELQIKHDDVAEAIIMIENTIRPELFFRVKDVSSSHRMLQFNNDFTKIGSNLQKLNDPSLVEKSKLHHKQNFNDAEDFNDNILFTDKEGELMDLSKKNQNDFFAIIFCPVKGTKRNVNGEIINKSGVDFVYQNLDSASKGYFYSSETEFESKEIHDHFVNFTTDKTKHMVCTKAFGMGIDKRDIRCTYHYFYSGSLESLVQEAGRSGRDKKISEANILVSKTKCFKVDVYKLFLENADNILLQNRFTRKSIRQTFEKRWNEDTKLFDNITFLSLDNVLHVIDGCDFSLTSLAGTIYNVLPPDSISELKSIIQEKDANDKYKYIVDFHDDRSIHEYFHVNSFKGIDTEKSQIWNLFHVKEFENVKGKIINIVDQDTLLNAFNSCQNLTFDFIITSTKIYREASKKVCKILHVNPDSVTPFTTKSNEENVRNALQYAHDFNDFLFILDEKNIVDLNNLSDKQKSNLLHIYSRDRKSNNDTGRLIYRMHSMGFLEDYLIDYNLNNLYNCTFRKFNSIDEYTNIIENYLRRYLSENTAMENIKELKSRLTNPTLIENIIECLYFLAEFSYKEIASKRKRATDEIETILNTSITEEKYITDWYEQNLYIKEQIFFYFNAKYEMV